MNWGLGDLQSIYKTNGLRFRRTEAGRRGGTNLALPLTSLGNNAAVALNRAKRASPQHIKAVKTIVSKVVRSPIQNANKAGATPNEIYQTKTTQYPNEKTEKRKNKTHQVCQ